MITPFELRAKIKRHNAICVKRDQFTAQGVDDNTAWRLSVESLKTATPPHPLQENGNGNR